MTISFVGIESEITHCSLYKEKQKKSTTDRFNQFSKSPKCNVTVFTIENHSMYNVRNLLFSFHKSHALLLVPSQNMAH